VDKLKSRKFWVSIGSGLLITALLIAGYIDQQTWAWGFGATVVGYLTSQGAVDAAEKFKG